MLNSSNLSNTCHWNIFTTTNENTPVGDSLIFSCQEIYWSVIDDNENQMQYKCEIQKWKKNTFWILINHQIQFCGKDILLILTRFITLRNITISGNLLWLKLSNNKFWMCQKTITHFWMISLFWFLQTTIVPIPLLPIYIDGFE